MVRRGLRVPSRLSLVTVASASIVAACGPNPVADVADVVDAVSDDIADAIMPMDATEVDVCEVPPGAPGYVCMVDPYSDANPTCPANRTCEATTCPTGCISCQTSAFEPGFACIADPHADATPNCPMRRVCAASDCPSGCQACSAPYFCYPQPDSGVTACSPQYVCNPSDCQPACTPLG